MSARHQGSGAPTSSAAAAAAATAAAQPGASKVGKYLLLDKLGEGAFGKVRLAVDSTTGFEYAIKIIDKRHIEELGLTLQVRREICVMKALRHRTLRMLCHSRTFD
jgi:serine/threonine protein kinase